MTGVRTQDSGLRDSVVPSLSRHRNSVWNSENCQNFRGPDGWLWQKASFWEDRSKKTESHPQESGHSGHKGMQLVTTKLLFGFEFQTVSSLCVRLVLPPAHHVRVCLSKRLCALSYVLPSGGRCPQLSGLRRRLEAVVVCPVGGMQLR